MKHSDLRLGILVLDVQSKQPVVVDENITQECFNGMDFYDPIPLSEDWMLKFRFENLAEFGSSPFWCIGMNPITKDNFLEIKFSEVYGFYFKNAGHPIKYVHQLQTLYYVLAGTELEISPTQFS